MLGIKDQRNIHPTLVFRTRFCTMQKPQKMTGQGFLVRIHFDASAAMVTKVIPVAEHRRERCQEPLRNLVLLRKIAFGLEHSRHRGAGSQDIHRMRIFWNPLKHLLELRRQKSKGSQGVS